MVRIIGGRAKGRRIEVPPGGNTRPTSAVVREAVFGVLQPYTESARVLDLFCGSGAYALEALSRGAKHAVLADRDAQAVAVVRRNVKALGFSHIADIYQQDYSRSVQNLRRDGRIFDIIFLDPPYAANLYEKAVDACLPLLDQHGRIVCEHPASMNIRDTDELIVNRVRRYGKRAITILSRRNEHDRNLSGEL